MNNKDHEDEEYLIDITTKSYACQPLPASDILCLL